MRILLLNPNTTAAMTQAIAAEASRALRPGDALLPVTARFGHAVIADRVSYAVAEKAAVAAYAETTAPHDAVVLACFGDPGLAALRAVAAVPVVGLAEAAFAAAGERGQPFAVLTIGPAWKPILEESLALHPAGALCRAVHAMDGTGLDFAGHPAALVAALDDAAAALVAAGAHSIVLGGSVLAGLAPRLRTAAHFIDPVAAAMQQVFA